MNTLRNVILLLFIASFLSESIGPAVLITGFYCNRSYIAKNLCEQRGVPGNCCQGSCRLRKALNDEAQKEQSNLPGSSKEQDQIKFVIERPFFPESYFTVVEYFQPSNDRNGASPRIAAVFHPPEFVTEL